GQKVYYEVRDTDFVLGVLLKQAWTRDNIIEYNKNYDRVKPRFILGYLTAHLKVNRFTFSFWEGDQIDAPTIQRAYRRLNETFYLKNLTFRPDSPMQEKVAKQVAARGIATITNDQIYKEAPYQAFNRGSAVGTLRVIKPDAKLDTMMFDRNDIVLLQESYPDIAPVSGILTTVFSTPLSHVNLRATAWGIPNAGYTRARDEYGKLDGQKVYYEVRDTDFVLRPATEAEIRELDHKINEQRTVKVPAADLGNARMAMLPRIHARDVVAYGTKCSNLGEIVSAHVGVNVPDGFGLPIFYYQRHMLLNGLDKKVNDMLADPRWASDAAWRKAALEDLQKQIKDAPIDPAVLDAVYKRVRLKLGGKGVFVRSSTNAEDLEGFNGAGLYDTVPNVRGKKQIGEAIKTVWASLWNWRAVQERAAFGIDHHAVYAGVLIQIGVNASASGVLITDNLWNPEDDNSYTINAKKGLGMRVVEGKNVPEQVIFDTSNDGTKIISRSDDPVMLVFDDKGGIREVPNDNRGVILTEERAKRLAEQVQRFVPLFSRKSALDVEWVLQGEEVWIVQARPYVAGKK
ncbi:MAG TPA: PEP/pyruvate-binding domain-containing protein, partial [Kofleriaceae bacterium]|nr:PEP/pyruvate-binding domain-containing protein [Kofleriaceae bacterium]